MLLVSFSFVKMAPAFPLKVATINVRGLAEKRKQSQLYRLVTERYIDVLAVQETKVDDDEATSSMVQRFASRFYVVVSHAVGTTAGCILFVKKLPGLQVNAHFSCAAGRCAVLDFTLNNTEWRVVCVYAPNKVEERALFFHSLEQRLSEARQLMLLGDFNCVLSAHDKTSSRGFRDQSTDVLTRIVEQWELEDVAECVKCDSAVKYTRYEGPSYARLDRIYVSVDILLQCTSYNVVPVSFSDHCLVQCSIGITKRSHSFSWETWKLNNRLLQDEQFNLTVKAEIAKLDPGKNLYIWQQWELCKETLKLKAIERATCIRQDEKRKEKELKAILEKLLKHEYRAPGKWIDDIRKVKQKIEQLDVERYRGAIVRARAEDTAAGEMPSKRALCLEKARAENEPYTRNRMGRFCIN
uniref:exodeoxyribonuclease III n=1 Tax=Rhipicephalus pulchellus TaxID=72859 RepID=L7LZ86_RHIPC